MFTYYKCYSTMFSMLLYSIIIIGCDFKVDNHVNDKASIEYPGDIAMASNEESGKMQSEDRYYASQHKKMLLLHDYAAAIAILPKLEEEMSRENGGDYSQYLHILHGCVIYTYLMAGRNEDALRESDKILERYGDTEPQWTLLLPRITLLSKFDDKYDEILQECQKHLNNSNTPGHMKFVSLHTMTLSYIAKRDIEKTREYFSKANTCLNNFVADTKNEMEELYVCHMWVNILNFYISNYWDTHKVVFTKDKPAPAEKDLTDPEGKRVTIELDYSIEFISLSDGSKISYKDMKLSFEKTLVVPDPFLEELERIEEDKPERKSM